MSESDPRHAAYRDRVPSSIAPLTVHYFAFTWYEAVRLAVLVFVGQLFVTHIPSSDLPKYLAGLAAFALVLMAMAVPVVRIAARVEGGHVVVRSGRWPGPEVMWSCTVAEASAFELLEQHDAKERAHFQVALRTQDDQVLALTSDAYRSVRFIYPRVLRRLNAWLDETGAVNASQR
jgi:hypothetical protein